MFRASFYFCRSFVTETTRFGTICAIAGLRMRGNTQCLEGRMLEVMLSLTAMVVFTICVALKRTAIPAKVRRDSHLKR
jgi:hypothetical protein